MSGQKRKPTSHSFPPIAIVGQSALLPGAPDIDTFWRNVLNAHVSIKEVSPTRWDPRDFWIEGEPGSAPEGKTYSKIGGFIEDFEFDWRRWKQPPGTLTQIDDTQLWAVKVAAAALEDAGYLGEKNRLELDSEMCGVIFANALGGENRLLSGFRVHADEITRKAMEAGMPSEGSEKFKEALVEGTPRVDEDTMAGELANVVAGRVANLLDLQGPNFSADAACASTFAALVSACQMLHSGQTDVMICGASDRTMDPATYAKFSAIGALSPIHSRPFDARANGFVMGEGAGCVVLKRLEDAIADGDTIYSVIRGIGASSDGRGKGITAPSTRGQKQALNRAYEQAGYSASTVELIEAHGTSTKVGDATELSTLAEVFSNLDGGDAVAVGSVKSQIGHLKAAAGMAGLLKASLALHHRTIPPSAGFEQPNTAVNWNEIPFFVPTVATEWPLSTSNTPRRAGISSFGFGGTNFHCALEQYDPEHHLSLLEDWDKPIQNQPLLADSVLDNSANPSMTHEELKAIEGGVLLLNASDFESLAVEIEKTKAILFSSDLNFDNTAEGRRLSAVLPEISAEFLAKGARCAVVATSWAQLEKRMQLLSDNLDDRDKWDFLAKQMVFITDEPPLPSSAKLVQMFPGQGSQYVGMTLDLSKRFNVIGETWDEADKTMIEILDGEKLSEFVLRENLSPDEVKIAEEKLKQTEFTQPAMLTADLAIYRLLQEHDINPDMVAGHSLGEYAALMVSGIIKFHDALRAAAARGTEMGNVDVPDQGLMASVTAPFGKVEEVINSVDGYVIAANKNSPLMTVIAGDTPSMQSAISKFDELNIPCVTLQTSHAFHSSIIAPANEPLRRFLEGLELSLPTIPITANYDGQFYPNNLAEGETIHDAILRQLAPQMSSAVEWTEQVQEMYSKGGRLFMEVGPKRALALFAEQILHDREKVVTNTNHPKVGGVASFLSSIAVCALAGRVPSMHALNSDRLSSGFRAGPLEVWQTGSKASVTSAASSAEMEDLRVRARPLPSSGVTSHSAPQTNTPFADSVVEELVDKEGYLAHRISELSGYPTRHVRGELDLSTFGIAGASLTSLLTKIAAEANVSGPADASQHTTLTALNEWVLSPPTGFTISRKVKGGGSASQSVVSLDSMAERKANPYVVTGVSLGLPGLSEVFAPDALERIVAGENFISELPDEVKQRLLDKNMVRIVKHQDGRAEFVACDSFATIPQLAGVGGYFDLAEQYGVDEKIVAAMDIATTLSFAAGLEALTDAALPLLPVEQVSSVGKRLIRGWNLPNSIRERTGVVFASVFPGIAMAMRHALNNGADENGTFDRRFLLQVLTMGHAQFAQWIGARGPNAAINNACASTPAAFAIAEDWLATGRCDRVIVISGDDSTGDDLMEWIGAGFAAAGAHSMGNVVEEVALPFDARRNGMLLGMGGAAFVIEKSSHANERGVVPYAELLGAHIGNSAFHPTRLDVEHVVTTFDNFVTNMENRWGIDRHQIAPKTTFMSHEPFTPPRGGSAAAEIESLRGAFKESAEQVIITNTKGFTGHPMGVGIEDATGLYALASGRLPPIANFKEPDESLGNLRLSEGGEYDVEYMLRHAAGFGSQIALTMFKRIARTLNRVDREAVIRWAAIEAGDDVELRLLKRKLVAYVSPDDSLIGGMEGNEWVVSAQDAAPENQTVEIHIEKPVEVVAPMPTPEPDEPVSKPAPTIVGGTSPDIEAKVIETVAEHTGYPADFIELDQDLEGELGIDTVKQAEIMADLRTAYSLPVDDTFQLREHPTLNHMIAYIVRMNGDSESSEHQPLEPVEDEQTSGEEEIESIDENQSDDISPPIQSAAVDSDVEAGVLEIVVKHTGYPEDFLELDQDLEGELGIDTVKQAEIMADCRERYSLPVDEEFQLREYPTLAHMIGYIISMRGDSATVETIDEIETEEVVEIQSDEEPVEKPSTDAIESGVHRWVVEVEEAELGQAHPLDMGGSYVIVTDDSWGLGNAICQRLESDGIEAVRLMLDPSIKSKVRIEKDGEVDIIRLDPGNPDHILQFGEVITDLDVAGVIHTAPCTLAGMAWAEVTSRQQTQMVCHGLFGVLQQIDAKLAQRSDGIVCSISALDGRHGNGGHRFNALGAGAHGIVKSYGRERPNIRSRALDVAPELLVNADDLAATILSEIEQMGPRELGIDADGRRWSVCIYDEPHENGVESLQSDDVFLVSGGGSGVTAACVVGLAEANQNVGCHFSLLGRTTLDASLSKHIDVSDEELNQMKMELREQMQSESGKVTIVDWEGAWSKIVRSLDIHRTIALITASGNSASYHVCDVTNSKHIRKVLKKLKKKRPPVTGIIHGAGIEDSKLISDKDWDTFSKVMAVKVDGWQALINAVKDHSKELRYCCAFTSIAGRFGNGGQTDYAAANCILDAEMSRLTHTDNEPHGLAIAWTGWRDVGMATRGSIEKVFSDAGIETVSVDQGVDMFVEEVMRGGKRRVVIAGSLGILNDDGSDREPPQRLAPEVAALLSDAARFPFVDKITNHESFDTLSYECTLDTTRFPFLDDHEIENVPYHPGVMALEMFSEAAQLLWPPCSVIGFAGVNFGLPIKLLKDEMKVRVVAEFSHQNDNNVWVKCRLESDLINKKGEIFGEPRIHHKALVRLLKKKADRGLLKLPSIGMPSKGGVSYGSEFVYKRFFHGPKFQSHGGIQGGCHINGMDGADGIALSRHQLPDVKQFAVGEVILEAQPMLIEACFQNAGMVAMEIDKIQSLPIGIEMLELIRTPEVGDSLRMRAVRRGAEDDGVTIHDCMIVNQDSKPVVALKGLRLKGMAPIDSDDYFSLNRN
ncbi:MAG: SDR family NAD(P)-dependent oxidoreductase [Euryarchaeota archaeon]|jgi:acyl transferase domain-containing protein/acyl carrier protein/NAD(P)-dependent dehydrogenase (short-subunit alcohol dehydrogenase family)|nr:SDR family NAD(P)-dependent oxidoreductase [Euryarchaeota archaeon]